MTARDSHSSSSVRLHFETLSFSRLSTPPPHPLPPGQKTQDVAGNRTLDLTLDCGQSGNGPEQGGGDPGQAVSGGGRPVSSGGCYSNPVVSGEASLVVEGGGGV